MILRERLKQEIDTLDEGQLLSIAEFLASIKAQTQEQSIPFWQRATPAERAQNFKDWVTGLSKTSSSLTDDSFNRGSIYE